MKVYLNEITGMNDGLVTLYLSKRSWSPELDNEIRRDWRSLLKEMDGRELTEEEKSGADKCEKRIETFCKYAWKHTAMLDFVTISVTVEGLHRAGQDDWDSHAKRFDNRIIRSSTRLADFESGEMSDWYKDKIIPMDEMLKKLGMILPERVISDGKAYVRAANGYVLQEMKDDKDVKRGLYMECIPSNFIFKCNMAQWAHVYRMRNKDSTANPEVKQVAEMIQDEIEKNMPWFDREFLSKVVI